MEGNKGLSVLAGIVMGSILGMWIYFMAGLMLAYGPVQGSLQSTIIPPEIRKAFLVKILKFGVAPGIFVGFIGGLVLPFHLPRGHMSKSIGTFCWIPITVLAWVTQWSNIHATSGKRIAIAAVMTFISLILIIPISESIGYFIERIREP